MSGGRARPEHAYRYFRVENIVTRLSGRGTRAGRRWSLHCVFRIDGVAHGLLRVAVGSLWFDEYCGYLGELRQDPENCWIKPIAAPGLPKREADDFCLGPHMARFVGANQPLGDEIEKRHFPFDAIMIVALVNE